MNKNNENWLIILYNLYAVLLVPALIVLAGIWSLETESDFSYGKTGGLPIGALIIFVPEIICGLKWKLKRIFTIVCSIVWFILLCKSAHRFFITITHAPLTYYCIIFIMFTGMLWSIIIELNQDLREHILMFPQEQWLVPCSNNAKRNKIYQSAWKLAVILGTVFTLSIKWS